MATVTKWSNVAVAMQSALAAADTITGITKASPGVVTATAHGLNNGDYVLLSVQGMYELNERVVRVANKTTDTFELEGVDTTSFGTFSSGTAEAITFGTTMATATTVSNSGGGFEFIDTTTIHDATRSQVPGLPAAATYSMDHLWDPADACQIAMKSASDAQAKRAFKFTFGTGGKIMVFSGYVGFDGVPAGSAQDKVTTTTAITVNGKPTYYAS